MSPDYHLRSSKTLAITRNLTALTIQFHISLQIRELLAPNWTRGDQWIQGED